MNLSQVSSLSDVATLFLINPANGDFLRDEDGTQVGISLFNSKMPSKTKPFQRELITVNACRDRALSVIKPDDVHADEKVKKIEGAHYDRVQTAQAAWYNSLLAGVVGKLFIDDKPLSAENFSEALNRYDWLSAQVEAFLADTESFAKKPAQN